MIYKKYKKGQTSIEYIVLVTIVLGALLGISLYFKRGLQGRWKAVVDDVGDQYDPRVATSATLYRLFLNSDTRISTVNGVNGFWTTRADSSNSVETRTGQLEVGSTAW